MVVERTIPKELHQKSVLQAVFKLCPNIPASVIYKAFRKRDVKYNGKRISKDGKVFEGGILLLYGVQELTADKQSNLIHYEDQHIVIVDKPQGLPVHGGKSYTGEETVIGALEKIAGKKLYLCHRLDRNTGGLMMVAKSKEVLNEILNRMKKGQIKKGYTAWVFGEPEKGAVTKTAWLEKNAKMNRVFVHSHMTERSFKIITWYDVLEYGMMGEHRVAKVAVVPITGRTHQIRAHLAHLGHPVVGDGKYGDHEANRKLKAGRQQLFSTSLVFDYEQDGSLTGYLGGRKFERK